MVSMKRGQELHDRATRNKPLTEAERAELREWYAWMDAGEETALTAPAEADIDSINAQIDAKLTGIQATTRRIIAVRRENQTIRRRIAKLES